MLYVTVIQVTRHNKNMTPIIVLLHISLLYKKRTQIVLKQIILYSIIIIYQFFKKHMNSRIDQLQYVHRLQSVVIFYTFPSQLQTFVFYVRVKDSELNFFLFSFSFYFYFLILDLGLGFSMISYITVTNVTSHSHMITYHKKHHKRF